MVEEWAFYVKMTEEGRVLDHVWTGINQNQAGPQRIWRCVLREGQEAFALSEGRVLDPEGWRTTTLNSLRWGEDSWSAHRVQVVLGAASSSAWLGRGN